MTHKYYSVFFYYQRSSCSLACNSHVCLPPNTLCQCNFYGWPLSLYYTLFSLVQCHDVFYPLAYDFSSDLKFYSDIFSHWVDIPLECLIDMSKIGWYILLTSSLMSSLVFTKIWPFHSTALSCSILPKHALKRAWKVKHIFSRWWYIWLLVNSQ